MAYHVYSQHYQDGSGRVINSGSVTVYLAGTTTKATIYPPRTSGASSATADADSVVSSDSSGKFTFFTSDADYQPTQKFKFTLSKTGYTTQTYDQLQLIPYQYVPGINNSIDLGSSSYRYKRVFTKDLNASNRGLFGGRFKAAGAASFDGAVIVGSSRAKLGGKFKAVGTSSLDDTYVDGRHKVTGKFRVTGAASLDTSLKLAAGATVTEFSTDGTMGGNSSTAVPVESAVVTYLTAFLYNYLSGLNLSNAADTVHDITIGVGKAQDSTNAYFMSLSSAITKQRDAVWAAGTNKGGKFTTVASSNDKWYHVFLIGKTTSSSVDAGFDNSVTASHKPSRFNVYRRIGAAKTAAASTDFIAFKQWGDDFAWVDPPLDTDDDNPGTNAVTRTLTVPTGVVVHAKVNLSVGNHAGGGIVAYLSPLDVTDEAASGSAAPLGQASSAAASVYGQGEATVKTNTSGQIRSRVSASDATSYLKIATLGWIDRRGRD